MPKAKPKPKKLRVASPRKVATLTTMHEVEQQLARIRAVLATDDAAAPDDRMSPNIRVKLSTEYRGWTKLKNEIEAKQALTEDAVSRHPRWLALRDQLVAVIAMCERCTPQVQKLLDE